MKSPFVRDLSEYERIGINAFKIAGGTNSVAWIEWAVRAYGEGNLLDVLDCPTVLRHLMYLDNSLRVGWGLTRGVLAQG